MPTTSYKPRPSTSKKPYSAAPPRQDGDSTTTASRPARPGAGARPPFNSDKGKAPARRDKGPPKDDNLSLSFANTILTEPPTLHANLRKLDLTNCGLTSLSFVREVRRSLTWLNVSGNNLRAPEAWEGVNELGGLFVLTASNCSLVEVPSVVEVLYSLKALVITHNSLKRLDHVKGLAHLNTIVASNNKLTSLPDTLATLPSLKKISAAHNLLTTATIPDLTSLSHLREVRLNDNPSLKSLPSHFGTWGKQPISGMEGSKRPLGLEIVDLGNCGFEDWFALKELAQQTGIVNLSLKGTKVAEEAKADGFEEFKGKITILLPNLRILDNQRFDAKFLDLKAKRDSRAPEQKVLDAGPMGLAINAAKEQPVEIPASMIAERERERREREIKRRRKAGLYVREDDVEKVEGQGEEEKTVLDVMAEEKKAQEDKMDEDEDEDEPAPKEKKKRVKKRKTEGEEPTEKTTEPSKKRKKNRHDARRDDEDESTSTSTSAVAVAPVEAGPVVVIAPTVPEAEPVPVKKRGRQSKDPNRPQPLPREKPAAPVERPRKRKDKNGVLAALRGDDMAESTPAPVAASVATVPEPATVDAAAQPEKKQKTSVLKVVEVQRKKEKDKPKVDVGSLLGLGAPAVAEGETVFGSGWD